MTIIRCGDHVTFEAPIRGVRGTNIHRYKNNVVIRHVSAVAHGIESGTGTGTGSGTQQ